MVRQLRSTCALFAEAMVVDVKVDARVYCPFVVANDSESNLALPLRLATWYNILGFA